ncbi:SusC/RagA family TonB-linked outer membrane protein [Elizabethkingia meningoseptica]|uniref:SusC/RagA family TonB-linked outer membrane protein n=1 Tax=Elizabethkingia meningoseptica TaxID=238 RepID=UPI0023AF60C7|nr:SusC/RagA family TonB-linked outer membrane protein [Elizabethkingia meningoseptica]
MSVKLRVLSAGVLFFMGQSVYAQKAKSDTTSTKEIEEVVVVGFGQKKTVQELTGSASTMTSKSIQDVPVASVDKMLQGRVTGVQTGNSSGQPGGFADVRVRGVSSINGVVTPIYVIDGVRVANGDLYQNNTTGNILANLNPDDIESITVLKDAVSTAVYGADAGAGVVVITTKSGKKGLPRFNVSFNSGFNDRAVKGYQGLNANQYKELVGYQVMNRYGASNPTLFPDIATTLANLKLGRIASLKGVYNSPYDTDWRNVTQKQGYQQNIDFSMNGGNDKLTYYASANYFDQNSIVRGSSFKRLAFSTKVDYQATEKLRISTDFQFSYGKINTLPNGGTFANPVLAQYFLRPTDPVYNPDGSFYLGDNNGLSNGLFNPAAIQAWNYSTGATARIYGNLKAEYKILKNLTYRFVFSPEYINIEEDNYWNPLHGDGVNINGYKYQGTNRYFNFNVQNILDYTYKLGLNNFSASLIQEAYKTDNRRLAGEAASVGNIGLFSLTNFVKPLSAKGPQSISSRYGYAVTAHYDYDRMFLLDASYRRDVLSNFVPGRKAGNFWSVGAGFDVARLDFIKQMEAISLLKFRASYGKLGNQVTANPYALYQYTTNYDDLAAVTYSGLYNPNLSWETVKPFNVGFDLGLLKNRITLSAEYYNKKTENLIYSLPLSGSQGLTSYVDNIGTLVNKGFEFSVKADIFRAQTRDQFDWTLGFNLSTLDNKITELYGGAVNSGTTTIRVGEGVRTFYLRKWAGVDPANGDPLWYINGKDGATTNDYNKAQQAVQGSFLSNVYGGANTSLSYKGFSLDLQFTYGFGGKMFDDWSNYVFSDGQYTSNFPGYADQMDFWTPNNPNAANPKPILGGNKLANRASTRFLYKTDYIRLSNAKFAYTFDSSFLQGSGLRSVQIYVMANNAWTHTFDKRMKMDPETNISGYSNLNLPVLKSFLLGVNVGF